MQLARYLLTTDEFIPPTSFLPAIYFVNCIARQPRPSNCIAYFLKSHSYALSATRKPNFRRTLFPFIPRIATPLRGSATAIEETSAPDSVSFLPFENNMPTSSFDRLFSVVFLQNTVITLYRLYVNKTLVKKNCIFIFSYHLIYPLIP